MLFAPISEPFIIGERGGAVAVFKPRGWHSVALAGGQSQTGASMVGWLAEHARELFSEDQARTLDASLAMGIGGADERAFHWRTERANDRFSSELGMLYRLDFDTSGIMLFALTRAVFERMTRAQEERALEKRYVLLCTESPAGVPGSMPVSRADERAALLEDIRAGRGGRVESYFRGYGARGARVACIAPEYLKTARKKTTANRYETRFLREMSLDPDGNADFWLHGRETHLASPAPPPLKPILMEVGLHKGFRHQIRAHSAWMGLPIVGDSRYGGAAGERLFLEARAVAFMDGGSVVEEWILPSENEATRSEGSSLI